MAAPVTSPDTFTSLGMVRSRRLLVAVVLGLAVHGACGGQAVIDGGDGGASTTESTGSTSPLCSTPDPVGTLGLCTGTTSAGPGMPTACESSVCDSGGNTWTSLCDDDGCQCRFNGQQRCTCVGGSCGDSCCPSPFPS